MAAPFISFEWGTSQAGYKWTLGEHQGRRVSRGGTISPGGVRDDELDLRGVRLPYLTAIISDPADRELIYQRDILLLQVMQEVPARPLGILEPSLYNPFDANPSLFLEFADLDLRLDECVKFANHWGSLGGDTSYEVVPVSSAEGERDSRAVFWGEPLGIWFDEIREMRAAVRLWDMAKRDNREALEALIEFEDKAILWSYGRQRGEHRENGPDEAGQIPWDEVIAGMPPWDTFSAPEMVVHQNYVADPVSNPERLDLIEKKDFVTAAFFVVQDFINDGLRARASPELKWEASQQRHATHLVPSSLIGALWLQLALAVEGNKEHRQCHECKSWFEIFPGSGRPDKLYCSDACRMRAYRKRKVGRRRTIS